MRVRAAIIFAALLGAVVVLGAGAGASGAASVGPPKPLPVNAQQHAVCAWAPLGFARCNAHVVTNAHSTVPLASKTYQSGYAPSDLKSAYAIPSSSSSATVAIVDAYDNPYAEADLNAYRQQFGLGPCTTNNGCFRKVNQTGGTKYPKGDTSWGAEIDLDIEMVSAACPSCKILLVEANSNSFTNLMAAVSYATAHADYVSNSYGGSEFSSETSYDSNFNAPGVGITVSAGDSGYGVEYPAASPYVTAVGGTSLTQSNTTRGWSESVWSGTGSGCSAVEPQQSWQNGLGFCTNRTVADVSAVADPYTGVAVYDSYGSSGGANWYVYGGTSVASPLIAGIWATTGSLPSGATASEIPYLNQSGWNDVTSGTNSHHCRAGYLCFGEIGYDGPTGLGTPIGNTGFTNTGTTGGTGGGGTVTGSPQASFTDLCSYMTCSFTDTSTDNVSGVSITKWSWNFGDGSTSAAQNPSHTYAAAGTYTVTLTVTDSTGVSSQTSVGVSVTEPPINLTASGYKTKGREYVQLNWSGGSSPYNVFRDGSQINTSPVTGTSYLDATGNRGGATFNYQVCTDTTPAVCSGTVTVTF